MTEIERLIAQNKYLRTINEYYRKVCDANEIDFEHPFPVVDEQTKALGDNIKVLLPGERLWVKVIEISDERFKGQIINTPFHELSEHEQARFMKQEFGEVAQLSQLHSFKKGDVIWFENGTGNKTGWWVPVDKGQ